MKTLIQTYLSGKKDKSHDEHETDEDYCSDGGGECLAYPKANDDDHEDGPPEDICESVPFIVRS